MPTPSVESVGRHPHPEPTPLPAPVPRLNMATNDPFRPVLYDSPVLEATDEQRIYIRAVLDLTSSDTQFAQKAYEAIVFILRGTMPLITSLAPSTVPVGPPLTLRVLGTGFKSNSVIVYNNADAATTYVSPTELTTQVNPTTAGQFVVLVRTGPLVSTGARFNVTPPVTGLVSDKEELKKESEVLKSAVEKKHEEEKEKERDKFAENKKEDKKEEKK